MEIVLVGLNHRTAPVEVRERVSFTAEQSRRAAEELRARGILEETLVLSTCNRSEMYGVPPESSRECAPGLSSFLSEFHSVRPDVLGMSLYHHYDQRGGAASFSRCCGAGLHASWAKRKFWGRCAKRIAMRMSMEPRGRC